jgi:hypothetical protein
VGQLDGLRFGEEVALLGYPGEGRERAKTTELEKKVHKKDFDDFIKSCSNQNIYRRLSISYQAFRH